MNNIKIFDTSLRDGAQTAGVNMTSDIKKEIGLKLGDYGTDKIEAGFAISSPGDFDAIKYIGENVKSQVYSLARANINDIDIAYDSLINSKNRGIHTFLGTSPMHRKYKLKMSKQEIITSISKHVNYARNKFNRDTDDIMFSPEDGMRTEEEFLFEAINAAIKAGATEINLPDTVGFAQNFEINELTEKLISEFGKQANFSIHTHNDLGQAVANSLAFVKAGGTIVQGTFPPAYGERAGNANLIQVMMSIIKRPDYYGVKLGDSIDLKKTYDLVSFIANKIGKRIPGNEPIIGRKVFDHSSGVHQHGINQHKGTYEIISPEEIGYIIESSFVLTNLSGRVGVKNVIKSYFGIELEKEKLNEIFEKFKNITSAGDSIVVTMDNIREILKDSGIEIKRNIEIGDYFINLDMHNNAKASVKLIVKGEEKHYLTEGVGAVDAIYKAIIKASGIQGIKLEDFSIQALTSDPSAQAKVSIRIEYNGKLYEEFGLNKDIVKASIQAFTNCLDRIVE